MAEISSENILFAAFFLGFLFLFMYLTCKSKPKSADTDTDTDTDDASKTVSRIASISDAEQIDEPKIGEGLANNAAPQTVEDLKIVEGIGPKIESLLHAAGITTMRNLANSETGIIKKILDDAGPRFRMHEPKTWSTQAKLIADESWDELKEYQDALNGGRDS